MEISSTYSTKDLFLKKDDLTNHSPITSLQKNLNPIHTQTPQSHTTPPDFLNNRPSFTLIKTDKTRHPKWNPLTKLTLATSHVVQIAKTILMKISSRQLIKGLFFNKNNAPTSESPQNLHTLEQTSLQENPDPSQDHTPQSYSAIRRIPPNNRPQLTIIHTDKTRDYGWSPLAKLALTAGVIKTTVLGYLAYTYKSTPIEISTKEFLQNKKIIRLNIPTTTPPPPILSDENNYAFNNSNKFHDRNVQYILNPESISLLALPTILAMMVPLVIGVGLGFFIKNLATDNFSSEDKILNIKTKKRRFEENENKLIQNTIVNNNLEPGPTQNEIKKPLIPISENEILENNENKEDLINDLIAKISEQKEIRPSPARSRKSPRIANSGRFESKIESDEEKKKQKTIYDFQKNYKTLIAKIQRQEKLAEKKEKISDLVNLLLNHAESEYAEIQQLLFDGFNALLSFSSSEATLFAIKCLDMKSEGCTKVASEAFSWLLINLLMPSEESSKVVILKNAIEFAKQCRVKNVDFAINNIKNLDVYFLKVALKTLLKKENFESAIEFIDLFLDGLNDGHSFSPTNLEFDKKICKELKKINEKLHDKYLEARNSDRTAFQPQEIIKTFYSIIYPPESSHDMMITS